MVVELSSYMHAIDFGSNITNTDACSTSSLQNWKITFMVGEIWNNRYPIYIKVS